MSNIIDSIQLSGVTYTLSAETSGGTVDQTIESGSTNAVAGGAVYDKFDEVEQVTARALIDLNEKKQDVLSAGTGIEISGNVISATGGITSGEVQTMIDTSISGKVNVSDNEVPPYYKTFKTGYWPESRNPTGYWSGVDAVKCQTNTFGSNYYGQKITIEVKDSSGTAYSGTNQTMSNKNYKTDPSHFLPTGMGDYLDVTFDIPETEWNTYKERYIVYTAKEGYKITYAEDFKGYDGNYYTATNIVAVGSNQIFEGGQSAYVIQNAIEPKIETISDSLSAKTDTSAFTAYSASVETALSGKQDVLSAGTGISISGNVISATGGGVPESAFTAYTATTDERISQDEEVTAAGLNALNDKITPTVELTQAQYDALVTAGTVSADTYYIITDATPVDMSNYYTTAQTNTLLAGKQATLVSGTNIKTINNESLLGSGNIDIQGGSTYTAGRGISIANDTISFSLPISADTNNNIIFSNTNNTISKYGHRNLIGGDSNTISYWGTSVNGNNNFVYGYGNQIYYGYSQQTYSDNAIFGRGNILSGGSGVDVSYSVIGGYGNYAGKGYTSIFGYSNKATNNYETALGENNVSNTGSTTADKTLFSVGNGTSTSARHNAFEIRQNGDIYLSLNGQDVKLQDQLGGSSITVDTALDSGSTNPVQNKVIYDKIDEVEQVTAAALNELNDNFGGLKLVKLTEAEYNALATKDPSTLYVIVN